MKVTLASSKEFLKSLFKKMSEDEISVLSAQLAYYLILSIFPFLIFVICIITYTPITSDIALKELSAVLPSYANIMVDIISQVVSARSVKLLIAAMLSTIWASSNGIGALIRGMNRAYGCEETRSFIKVKVITLAFTGIVSFIFVISLVTLVFGEVITDWLFSWLGISELSKMLWDIVRYVVLISAMIITFAVIYRYIPNAKLPIKAILPGTIFSTVGWTVLASAFSYYVSLVGNFTRMYGGIGGIIALLIWIYWNGMLILIGGELNVRSKWRFNSLKNSN